ncbi:MAG: hypothetical protein V3U52_01925 [Thermoplasmata archaeon]
MGLVENFLNRMEKASSIEEAEIVGQDFGRVKGLTADEKEKISKALERRFEELTVPTYSPANKLGPQRSSLDETIAEGGRQVLEELKEERGKPLSKAAVVVRDMAEKYDLPLGFILTFEDQKTGRISPYVTKAGLLYKLKQVGFRTIQVRFIKEDDEAKVYECEAAIYPNLSQAEMDLLSKILDKGDKSLFREVFEELTRPTIHRGRASPKTLKEKQLRWAKELAETRATLRAARVFTGCGLYMKEEVEEAP